MNLKWPRQFSVILLFSTALGGCAHAAPPRTMEQHYTNFQVPLWAILLVIVVLLCSAYPVVLSRKLRRLFATIISLLAALVITVAWIGTYNSDTYLLAGFTNKTQTTTVIRNVSVWSSSGTLMFW